jgi:deazaflavin-dependent oxidoreductase (nitroreductase family)
MGRRLSVFAAVPAFVLAVLLLVRFRPKSVARFNRAVTNRILRRFAGHAPGFGLVVHHGRKSGRLYRTPVNVFKIPDGLAIVLTYGPGSEWVQNVLAEGGAALETEGRRYRVSSPVVVHDALYRVVPLPLRVIPALAGVRDYLQLSASPE